MKFLSRVPFTVVLLIVLIALPIVTGTISATTLRDVVGIDIGKLARNEWWSLLTAGFFTDSGPQLVVVVIAAALGVGVAERLMGTVRTIVAFVVTGVLGTALGLLAQAIAQGAGEYWANIVGSIDTVDALTPIFGTVMAGSAYASLLWRRRIRIVVLAIAIVYVLYSGQPADFYRVIAAVLGLGLGALFARQRPHLERWTSSHHETRVLLATLTVIFAMGPVVTLGTQGKFGLLAPLGVFITDGVPRGSSAILLAVLPLVTLLIGAWGLFNGRRAAVWVVASLAGLNGALAIFYFGLVPIVGQPSGAASRASLSPEFSLWILLNAAIPLAFAAALLSQLRHFSIRAPIRARRRFIITIGVAAAVTSLGYLTAAWFLRAQFRPSVTFLDLLVDLPERFIPLSYLLAERLDFTPVTIAARVIFHGVGPLLWLVVIAALIGLLRGRRSPRNRPAELIEFIALMRRSSNSMAYPATWDGNRYWFDESRQLAIAYRIANGCAITVSSPVGTPNDARASVGEFIRFCDRNAWTPAFYGIHGEWSALLIEMGWSTTVVAEETIIDLAGFTMTGKKWQDVRSSINRAERADIRVVWTTWPALSVAMTNQIAEISESWVVQKKLPELGFTLGGIDELDDRDILLGLAVDSNDRVQAVTSWMPTWNRGVVTGYTLDFMRRRSGSMNGVMEFVIAQAALRFQDQGLQFLSLSGAPLALATSDDREKPVNRALLLTSRALEPVYGFRSLLAFKQKFQPRLDALYVAYPDALALPAVALAISRCYLPGLGFRESASLVRGLRSAPVLT